MYMKVAGSPVVFCFVAWMRDYKGATADDVPIWDGRLAIDGLARVRGRCCPHSLRACLRGRLPLSPRSVVPNAGRTQSLIPRVQAHPRVIALVESP